MDVHDQGHPRVENGRSRVKTDVHELTMDVHELTGTSASGKLDSRLESDESSNEQMDLTGAIPQVAGCNTKMMYFAIKSPLK